MRVLVLSDTYPPHNLGGAGEVADLVARRMAQRGHEVLVVAGVARRALAGESRDGGVTVHRIWAPVPSALRLHLGIVHPAAVAQVGLVARRFRPALVHAHNVHERLSFASLIAARRLGGPVLLTAHDYLLFCLTKFLCSRGNVNYHTNPANCPNCKHIRRAPGRNTMVHALVRRAVAHVACISAAQRIALRRNGFNDVPLDVVHNGLDPLPESERQALGRATADFRARHNLDGRPLVIFGGRISGAKGGDQLLRAVARARERVDCQLAIMGDRAAYFEHARRLATEVGLDGGALRTLGWLDQVELNRAYAAASVSATPSVYPDPFNLMTLRAMNHAKPVVGTCYGATPELVVDGVTGYVADPWDPASFGDRIADVLEDPARAAEMGHAGRERMEAHFTLDRQAAQYEALYERLCA